MVSELFSAWTWIEYTVLSTLLLILVSTIISLVLQKRKKRLEYEMELKKRWNMVEISKYLPQGVIDDFLAGSLSEMAFSTMVENAKKAHAVLPALPKTSGLLMTAYVEQATRDNVVPPAAYRATSPAGADSIARDKEYRPSAFKSKQVQEKRTVASKHTLSPPARHASRRREEDDGLDMTTALVTGLAVSSLLDSGSSIDSGSSGGGFDFGGGESGGGGASGDW